VPDLLNKLRNLHETKKVEAETLSREIEGITSEIREKRRSTQDRLEEVVTHAPWGRGPSPTFDQTTDRIDEFVDQLGDLVGQTLPDGMAPHDALEKATAWIAAISNQTTGTIQAQRSQLYDNIDELSELLSELNSVRDLIAVNTKSLEQHQKDIEELLGTQTEARLRAYVRELDRNQTERSSCASIAKRVREMCDQFDLARCPACGTEFGDGELFAHASDLSENDAEVVSEGITLDRARTRLQKFEISTKAKAATAAELKRQQETARSKLQGTASTLGISADDVADVTVNKNLEKMTRKLDSLQRVLTNRAAEKEKRLERIRALRQELSFHSYRSQVVALDEKLSTGLQDARGLLGDYHNLLDQVQRLRDVISQVFRRALDRAIPKLNDTFTRVYQRLTQQRSYERAIVSHHPEKVGELEFRVASTELPGQDFAINVLNGQAQRAVHLVPYLVFSKFQSDVLELDLLLIDDPSESFDTSHVSMLVDELWAATEHAQIVVASHEEEKFQSELSQRFSPGSYVNVNVSNFSRRKGPKLGMRSR
jgi:hypothetical protein